MMARQEQQDVVLRLGTRGYPRVMVCLGGLGRLLTACHACEGDESVPCPLVSLAPLPPADLPATAAGVILRGISVALVPSNRPNSAEIFADMGDATSRGSQQMSVLDRRVDYRHPISKP